MNDILGIMSLSIPNIHRIIGSNLNDIKILSFMARGKACIWISTDS